LVSTEIKTLCTLLREELDPLIRQFESTHPAFYGGMAITMRVRLADLPAIPRAKRQASRQAAEDKESSQGQSESWR